MSSGHKGLADRIAELADTDMTIGEIAADVGCSPANVSKIFLRRGLRGQQLRSAPITRAHADAILGEARRHNVTVPQMVRAILVDAAVEIIEARKERGQ